MLILIGAFVITYSWTSQKPTGYELRVLTYDESGGADFNAILSSMQNAEKSLIEDYRSRGIELTIKYELIPGDDEALAIKEALEFASGVGADIVLINPVNLGDFVEARYLLPITEYVNEWPDWNNYTAGAKSNGFYKGEQYTIPTGMWMTGMLYRKDVFQRVGLPLEWHPSNWQDIIDAALVIKENAPDIDIPFETAVGTIWTEDSTVHSFLPFLWGDGGEIFNYSTNKWISYSSSINKTSYFYHTMFINYELSDKTLNFEPNPYTAMVELFAQGEIGIFIQGAGIWDYEYGPEGDHPIENRNELIGYAPIPGSGRSGAPPFATMADSYTYGISASSKIPDIAFDFLKEWNTAKNLAHICAVGGPVAPRSDALDSPEYTSLPWRADWTEQIQYAHLYPIHEKYPEVSLLIQRLTERIVFGTPVDEALQMYKQELVQTVGASNTEELP